MSDEELYPGMFFFRGAWLSFSVTNSNGVVEMPSVILFERNILFLTKTKDKKKQKKWGKTVLTRLEKRRKKQTENDVNFFLTRQ